MNLWNRGQVLRTKARREGRVPVGHRHRWVLLSADFGSEWRCWTCQKCVTERQAMAAGPGGVLALFEPYEGSLPPNFNLGRLR